MFSKASFLRVVESWDCGNELTNLGKMAFVQTLWIGENTSSIVELILYSDRSYQQTGQVGHL